MAFEKLPSELAHHLDASDFYNRMAQERKRQVNYLNGRKLLNAISLRQEELKRIQDNGNGLLR